MWAFCLLIASLAVSPVEPRDTVSELFTEAGPSVTTSSSLVSEAVVASSSRSGKPFTKQQKQIIKERNAQENQGTNRCENCGVETVPGQKHEKGVTPPKNETQVDHKIPKVRGGPGDVDNAQVLCRDCNLKKGSKEPGAEESP